MQQKESVGTINYFKKNSQEFLQKSFQYLYSSLKSIVIFINNSRNFQLPVNIFPVGHVERTCLSENLNLMANVHFWRAGTE